MLVDRSAADIASARQRHTGFPVLAEKSANQIIGRSDLSDIVIVYFVCTNTTAVNCNCMTILRIRITDFRTNGYNRIQENIDIIHIRQVPNCHSLITHDRCCQNTKGRILCSANLYFANQRIPAFY